LVFQARCAHRLRTTLPLPGLRDHSLPPQSDGPPHALERCDGP
jgi:hypothetical protein